MTGRARFLNALKREEVDRTPIWIMRQAGRYLKEYRRLRERFSFIEMCKNPEIACEVALLPFKYAELDGAIIFADILLPLEAMGVKVYFTEEKGPVLERSKDWIRSLRDIEPREHLIYIAETVKYVKSEIKDRAVVIGFSGAPFTLLSYLIEGGYSRSFHATRNFMMNEKEDWHTAMKIISGMLAKFLLMQVEAGAEVVQIFDSWVGALSPDEYVEFVQPYVKEIISKVEERAPVIHFSTGTAGFLEEISRSGGTVIGIDWRISIDRAWKIVGLNRGIQGNLDPVVLMSSREVIESKVKDVLNKIGGRIGHIFNLGHGILPETPVENMQVCVEAVHKFSERK